MAHDDHSSAPRPETLISNLTGYIDTRIDLVRLELQQRANGLFISVVHGVFLAFFGLMFFLFLNLYAALALNDVFDSPSLGFAAVAGFYLLLLVLVLVGVDKKAFQGLADKALKDTIYKSDKH
ncbi:phage holin family protein [Hymenobacter nivis]|uniref:Phage holin family protein n=1 Tax=Hymenobacter nivis TaxID=1850093 RepID=A0A502GQ09_9BACT|nr:phage holin family protein [Hymenobacter nivis]TPG64417.1 phage holin family protein [Hymenobacter nivis]